MKTRSLRLRLAVIVMAVASLVFACNNDSKEPGSAADTTSTTPAPADHSMTDTSSMPLAEHAEAILSGTYPDTTLSGSVKFHAENGKVKMVLELTVAAKAGKELAVHLHEHGDCGDMGKMAHGHWNPGNTNHGKWGSAAFHLGDIGNVKLDGKGYGKLEMETDLWSLGGAAAKNIIGKAVIVHGSADDYTTQPTGNAGNRIGCGVIK